MSGSEPPHTGYRDLMDIPAFAILGVVLIVFIAGGLLFAFVADRRRNKDVANDTERLDPDPTTPPANPSDRHGG